MERRQGGGKRVESSLLQNSLCCMRTRNTAGLSPHSLQQKPGAKLEDSVFLSPFLGSLDRLLDVWGPPRSVEGASGLEVPVGSPYIRLVETSADPESRSLSPTQGCARAGFSLPVSMKPPQGVCNQGQFPD